MKQYILVIMDGAADIARIGGKSPLQLARIPNLDYLTYIGVSGLTQTLYEDLPKGSIVAILGLLGYDPYTYYPNGRASCEAMALNIPLGKKDIAFRANLAFMKGDTLDSYNAGYIRTRDALPIIRLVNKHLLDKYPGFEMHHNSDFRNTLIIRAAEVDPKSLSCPEPHENMGQSFNLRHLVTGTDRKSKALAERLNQFVHASNKLLETKKANVIFPWDASSALRLAPFRNIIRKRGPCCLIAHMDFLLGIAKAARIQYCKLGNGDWDTNYRGKGGKLIESLRNGHRFVCCHVNGPDESSHMGDVERKVYSIEQCDRHIVRPAIKYFEAHPERLGGMVVAIDHYTNHFPRTGENRRAETHSAHPVPFVYWNNRHRDDKTSFSEEDAAGGAFGSKPISHLRIMELLTRGKIH